MDLQSREKIEQIGWAFNEGDNTLIPVMQKFMQQSIEIKRMGGLVGASGAIFGLLLAFGLLFPDFKVGLLFLPFQIPAKILIPIMMVAELYLSKANFEWDNIAHYAHLGGALFGALRILYWRKNGDRLY